MFKKILIVLMVSCFLLGMATKAEAENAKEEAKKENPKDTITDTLAQTENKDENGYKIEVGKVKLRGEEKEEIRFISPEGNVVKTLEKYWYKENVKKSGKQWTTEVNHVAGIPENKNAVLLWKGRYSTDYDPRGVEGPHGRKHQYTVEFLNKKGESTFKKDFKAYPHGELTMPFWETDISKDGSTFYVFYEDSLEIFHIEIYDATGKKLAEAESSDNFYGGMQMQISPDGKIFGARIYKKGVGECLFFLDVESGKTKIVKAEGEVNGKRWSARFILSSFADPNLPPKGKIWLSVAMSPKNKWFGYLTFEEIPSNLSALLGREK
jgi:hypothetical protein